MTEEAVLALTVPATPAALDRVQDELARLWERHPGVRDVDRVRFETGLVEVLGNVVEHAFGPAADGRSGGTRELTVSVQVSGSRLSAVLEDNGRPVEVDLSDVAMPGPDAESGRGLALALATLDGLDHIWQGGRNRWTLWCSRGDAGG